MEGHGICVLLWETSVMVCMHACKFLLCSLKLLYKHYNCVINIFKSFMLSLSCLGTIVCLKVLADFRTALDHHQKIIQSK